MWRHCLPAALAAALLISSPARAGEGEGVKRIEDKKAEKLARLFDGALKKSDKAAPIKVTADFKKGTGLNARNAAALVVPDAKLTTDAVKALDKGTVPLGVLYLHRITVVAADEPVTADQHRSIEVSADGKEMTVNVLHLAAAKVAGRLVLLVYTNADTPALVTTLVDAEVAADFPLDLEARPVKDDRATLVLTVAGRYRAVVTLAAQP